MIRVLMLVPRFESTGRGVEVFAKYLAYGLDKTQFEVTVISGPHESKLSGVKCKQFSLISRETFFRMNWFLKRLPGRFLCSPVDLEALSCMWSARSMMKQESFDVIFPFGGTWTYRFARHFKKNAKIISIGHAGPVKADLALSDYFVALTPLDQSKAQNIVPAIGSTVIPNGVDLQSFHPSFNKEQASQKQTILCVGAFTEDKRQDLLLDAISLLPPTVDCILAGKGPRKQTLENHPLVKKGQVKLIEQTFDRMPELYRRASVFTLPSPNEAFGLVFLEALASGLPVVANNGPRQRFVIGQTGFFCDVSNQAEYAQALNNALNTPFDQARIDHANKFSWNKIVVQYAELIKSLI